MKPTAPNELCSCARHTFQFVIFVFDSFFNNQAMRDITPASQWCQPNLRYLQQGNTDGAMRLNVVCFLEHYFHHELSKKPVHLFFLLVLNFPSPFLRRPPSRSPMKISKKNKKLVSTFSDCRHYLHELCSYLSRT